MIALADIEFAGMDEAIRAMEVAGELTDDVINEMLQAGADVTLDELRSGVSRSRFRISDYAQNIKADKRFKRKRKNGDPYVTINVSGKNQNGERKAAILFVLNYGRREKYGKIEPGYFWTSATKKAQAPAAKAMEAVLEKYYKKEGL